MAVETKEKKVQETIVIEEGEKTLEDLIEEQRAKLHAEGKQARSLVGNAESAVAGVIGSRGQGGPVPLGFRDVSCVCVLPTDWSVASASRSWCGAGSASPRMWERCLRRCLLVRATFHASSAGNSRQRGDVGEVESRQEGEEAGRGTDEGELPVDSWSMSSRRRWEGRRRLSLRIMLI